MSAWDILQGIFENLINAVQFAFQTAGAKHSAAVVIFIFLAMILLVGADISNVLSLNDIIYGKTEKELQPFGNVVTTPDDVFEWMETVQMVEVYKPFFTISPETAEACQEIDNALPKGIVWRDTETVIFGYALPTVFNIIKQEGGACDYAKVYRNVYSFSSNGTVAGTYAEYDQLKDNLENVCKDDQSFSGATSPIYTYDSTAGGLTSTCYFLRNAITHERIMLAEAIAAVGSNVTATVAEDIYSGVLKADYVDVEDMTYKEVGILSPLIFIDKLLMATAVTLDQPFMALFSAPVVEPLYTFVKEVIMYIFFMAFLFFCLALVWAIHKGT